VAVHDAARPCIAAPWIDRVFNEAQKSGAAILAWPLHGTLKSAEGGAVKETLTRRELWEAQTPQVFRKDLLVKAYAAGTDATDDAAMVEALGHPVRLVIGDPRNIKITRPADLGFANAVIKTLPKARPMGFSHPFADEK